MASTAHPTLAQSSTTRRVRGRGLPGWAAAILLIAAAAYTAHEITLQRGLTRLREAADHRLEMLAGNLNADLARFDYLPALLEMMPVVPALLDAPDDLALRESVNRFLGGVNATAGAEMLYVLDARGTSVAASDWNQPGTTIGQDLSFRPYVGEAIQQGRARFYGVGITSRKPGYYLSYALRRGSDLRGLVAVKVNIEDAEGAWRKLPGDVVLLDDRGVVILSTIETLKYRPIAALDARQREEVARSRPYGQAALEPLRWQAVEAVAPNAEVITLDGRPRLASSQALKAAPWRLIALDDLAPVRVVARYAAFTGGLAMVVLVLTTVVLWQRRRAIRQKLASRAALQAAHDTLESTVVARTAELRDAQNDLVHAGKMAVLGQMSAGMVHELNQPLTAMRHLADSAGILLDQSRGDDVRDNLRRIAGMVDRLGRLTARLKTFAYRSDVTPARVVLATSIADACAVIGVETRERNVTVEVDVDPPQTSVLADESALASILVNLMRNALDAMQDAPVRVLRIEARVRSDRVVVTISDTGPGIRDDILPRLFEPFVTSKPPGAGLGLGLVIAAQQVRALGGTIVAQPHDGGGAAFVIELPATTGD